VIPLAGMPPAGFARINLQARHVNE